MLECAIFPKFRIENVCISEHSVEKQEIYSYLKIFRENNYIVNLLLSQAFTKFLRENGERELPQFPQTV